MIRLKIIFPLANLAPIQGQDQEASGRSKLQVCQVSPAGLKTPIKTQEAMKQGLWSQLFRGLKWIWPPRHKLQCQRALFCDREFLTVRHMDPGEITQRDCGTSVKPAKFKSTWLSFLFSQHPWFAPITTVLRGVCATRKWKNRFHWRRAGTGFKITDLQGLRETAVRVICGWNPIAAPACSVIFCRNGTRPSEILFLPSVSGASWSHLSNLWMWTAVILTV